MWNKLDILDWQLLGDETIPSLINQLKSKEPKVWNEAINTLYEKLAGDFDNSVIMSEAVPFLIKLLEDQSIQSRAQVLFLLWSIAIPEDRMAQDVVSQGILTYLEMLTDPSVNVRVRSVQVLSNLRPTNLIAESIVDCVRNEPNAEAQAEMIWQLGWLVSKRESTNILLPYITTELENLAIQSSEILVKLASAIALGRIKGKDADFLIDSILVHGIVYPEQYTDSQYTQEHERGWYNAYDALWNLGFDRAIKGFAQALNTVSTPYGAYVIAVELLNRVLGTKLHFVSDSNSPFNHPFDITNDPSKFIFNTQHPTTPIKTLDVTQKQVVSMLIACEKLWEIESNIFEIYGLPTSRKQMKFLLEKTS